MNKSELGYNFSSSLRFFFILLLYIFCWLAVADVFVDGLDFFFFLLFCCFCFRSSFEEENQKKKKNSIFLSSIWAWMKFPPERRLARNKSEKKSKIGASTVLPFRLTFYCVCWYLKANPIVVDDVIIRSSRSSSPSCSFMAIPFIQPAWVRAKTISKQHQTQIERKWGRRRRNLSFSRASGEEEKSEKTSSRRAERQQRKEESSN